MITNSDSYYENGFKIPNKPIETECTRNQKWIANLAQLIKQHGYRVFIASQGDYGFFTDLHGTKVISFQVEYLHFVFSGNYKTNNPKSCGTGWRICENVKDYKEIFNSYPPQWAVNNSKWKFTTLKEHLQTYQKSSKYIEV